jgi:hypothetical protein
MRVLGFDRSQVRAALRWQAFTLAVTGALVAMLFGILAGRAAFRRFATGLGVSSGAVTPAVLVLVPVAVLAVAALVSYACGSAALRREPGSALRTE